MITRIVRMSFAPENTGRFIEIFRESEHRIRAVEGCLHLAIYRDHHQSNVYYTISHWENEHLLEAYRNSELFKTTWAKVKPLFNESARAYSLEDFED